jgi:NADH-quinone oxidoreductase subunit H
MVVMILISVIFTTLLERKILGFSQNRLGVNKVGYLSGLVQSVLDGIKLIKKQVFLPFKSKALLLVLSPIILIVLILVLWMTHATISFYENFSFFFLFNICCIGIRVYSSLILR